MIKKIRKILTKKQKFTYLLLTILLFVGGLFDLLGVSLILPVVKLLLDPDNLIKAKWAVIICKTLNIDDTRMLIEVVILFMIIVYIIKNVYLISMYHVLYHFTYYYKKTLALRLLNCYIYQDYTFHLRKNVADLQRNILTDTGLFFDFIFDFLCLLNQAIVCALLGGYLLVVDIQTTLEAIVLLGSAMAVLYKVQSKKQIERGIANRESNAEMNKWIIQTFSGIKEIQVLGREQYFVNRCEEAYNKGMEANRKNNFATIIPKPITEMICVVGLLVVVLIRLVSGADFNNLISIMAVFAVAAFRMLPCFNSMSAYLASMLFKKDSVDAVFRDISEMEIIGEKKHLKEKKDEIKFKKEIKLEGLSYKYPDTERWILKDIDLQVKKNQSVGIIGTSGAGKSTLVDVLLGLLPIEKGSISVDGKSIENCMDSWHSMIGYIPQSIYLMDDTIKNNVAFGIPEDKISTERIWKALEEAQIADFVKSLPEGLDAQIGDRGVRISGGQRQRLGIARALYNEPQILVFDEATSSLDNETEAALMESIEGFKGNKTMLIIAHRLQTIENCDAVYEVINGRVDLTRQRGV